MAKKILELPRDIFLQHICIHLTDKDQLNLSETCVQLLGYFTKEKRLQCIVNILKSILYPIRTPVPAADNLMERLNNLKLDIKQDIARDIQHNLT